MRASDERGFTLLEMLVALTILGVAVAGLSSVFSFANATLQRTARALESIETLETLKSIVGDSLAERNVFGEDKALGDNAKLIFRAPAPRALGGASPVLTSFFYDSERKELHALWEVDVPGRGGIKHKLAGDVSDFRLSYSRDGERWEATSGPTIGLVRIDVAISNLSPTWQMTLPVRTINSPYCRASREQMCRALQ